VTKVSLVSVSEKFSGFLKTAYINTLSSNLSITFNLCAYTLHSTDD